MLSSRDALADPALDGPHRVTMPSDGGRGPTVRSVIVLAISALALLGTTPAQPTIAGRVIGEVVVARGETVERAGKASHAAVTFWIVTILDT